MCGIAGFIDLGGHQVAGGQRWVDVMGKLLAHRGPDGEGTWLQAGGMAGMVHRRLAIIDLGPEAAQPMEGYGGLVLSFNGEIYNYRELRDDLAPFWPFKSHSDTETILAAYFRDGMDCLGSLRGMFAFALWDERRRRLFCARDRFGIKPFYYAQVDGRLLFASEIKALLPFLPEIDTDRTAFEDYLVLQMPMGERTMFRHVHQLPPGCALVVEDGEVRVFRYWDIHYAVDEDHSPAWFENQLVKRFDDSIRLHMRSDVPVGAYFSGGYDSTLVAALAKDHGDGLAAGFHGRFADGPAFDESMHAQGAAEELGLPLDVTTIGPDDFLRDFQALTHALDHPVAGPGSFAQYQVSAAAARKVKVVLGGQGGDEMFAGYARYLLAYFEQCFKAAIEDTYHGGSFVVSAESIFANLAALGTYKPMIREFFKDGLFGPLDARYFRLLDKSKDLDGEIEPDLIDRERVFRDFQAIFESPVNVGRKAYLDKMLHFDFKVLLPALLHVEDRVSMAHGLESRVPFLDHPMVELLATVPATEKFKDGQLKRMLRVAFDQRLPKAVLARRDKMGFPVPLNQWFEGPLKDWVNDLFRSQEARNRSLIRADRVIRTLDGANPWGRRMWGLTCLEMWWRTFHDRAAEYRKML